MLKKIRVIPLAAESLGVRSMATFVETVDVKILLDAGVSLAPNRFGFPPHPLEYKAIIEAREKIRKAAEKAEVVTISHYHFDHHTPSYVDWCYNWTDNETARQIYKDKTVLVKNYKKKINFNQRRRGWMFTKTSGKDAEKIEVADGKTFNFGETKLMFSEPVFHGQENTALGWLLMVTIQHENEKVMFAPDVQGPMYSPTLDKILDMKPDMLIIGGPPLYLSGFRVKEEQITVAIRNLEKIAEKVPLTILEHHLLRDEKWKENVERVFEKANEKSHKVLTAAEFLGLKNRLLEAIRDKLYERYPPSKEFEKWSKLPLKERKKVMPPI